MAEPTEERYERTFDVGEQAELTLRNVRGPITISGWDKPQISVVAVKKRGTEWGAQDAFDDTTVDMEQDGTQVRVRTNRAGSSSFLGWIGFGRTPPSVSYQVQAPVSCTVSVRTVSSDISISNLLGSVYAKAVSGKIILDAVSGQIITSSVEAVVHGNALAGSLVTRAVAASATITQSRLTSFSGKSVDGNVSLETTIDPAGAYALRSVSGSLRLLVPPDTKASASVHGVSSHATCDLPCTVTEHTRGRWSAQINGGGAEISLASVSGDLSLLASTAIPPAAERSASPAPAAPPSSADWPEMAILKAVERGEISVEDAVTKLAALDKTNP